MKKFIKWLNSVHSSGTPESAKRFYGAIGFLSSICIIAFSQPQYADILLYTSAALLGLETIFNVFKKS
jgi:hypothetical protein